MKKKGLNTRARAIKELIQTHPIEDQAALIDLLKKEYAIETNQAAVSRDLRALGIYKRARGEHMVYELPETDPITEMLQYAVQAIHHNEAMIIVNTVPGTAAMVADFIDAQNNAEILATIAGENVVFIAPRTVTTINTVAQQLRNSFKIKEEQ